jgi:hypothetical protein
MEEFQMTRSPGRLGLPASVQFDIDDLRRQYEAARVGLIVDDTADNNNEATDVPVTSAPQVGIDDHSQGYLKRSVIDPRYLSK